MATVLVKNLPNVTAINDDDLLIVNVGSGSDFTTSNIEVAKLRESLNATANVFGNDIEVNGNVTIPVTSTQAGKAFIGNLVGSVTGSATTVTSLTPHTTADLPEDPDKVYGNLYFTLGRFDSALAATPLARHSDVVLTGGADADKARDGDFLLYNGVTYRFENVASATYDQRTEVSDLRADVGTVVGSSLQTQVTNLSDYVGTGATETLTSLINQLRTDLGPTSEYSSAASGRLSALEVDMPAIQQAFVKIQTASNNAAVAYDAAADDVARFEAIRGFFQEIIDHNYTP